MPDVKPYRRPCRIEAKRRRRYAALAFHLGAAHQRGQDPEEALDTITTRNLTQLSREHMAAVRSGDPFAVDIASIFGLVGADS